MDAAAVILLMVEAVMALLLLYFDGLLKKPVQVLTCAGLVAAAFVLRALFFSYETLDYQDFLARWVQYFRDNGGFAALKDSVGNYNVPYLYFLALFSYVDIYDLYLIKLLSTFFDVLLAFGAMRLTGLFTRSRVKLLFVYFAVLFWPTVVLNSAVWGQCDSIYVALGLLAVYWAMDGRPVLGMAAMAASFAFKLQAVFIMPVFVLLLIARRVKLWHFLVFPAVYMLLMLPAVFAGRPVLDTITLYFDQMGTVGSALNYNSPSVYAFARNVADEALASKLGIAAAFALMLAVFGWFWWRRAPSPTGPCSAGRCSSSWASPSCCRTCTTGTSSARTSSRSSLPSRRRCTSSCRCCASSPPCSATTPISRCATCCRCTTARARWPSS